MFTGIIENAGTIQSINENGTGRSFRIQSPIATELKVDQSLAHDGVCLTVEDIDGQNYQVTAVLETLNKTNLASWMPGTLVNLERCMQMNGRLDGHIVQGHVDSTGICTSVQDLHGSWEYRFRFPIEFSKLVIEKGSICVNGISLTAYNVGVDEFSVAIIPFTFEHTNISQVRVNDRVNLEFDVIGKYIQRALDVKRET